MFVHEIYGMDGITATNPHFSLPMFSGNLVYNNNTKMIDIVDLTTGARQSYNLFSSASSVALTPETKTVIEWARKKMHEEAEIDKILEEHPNLKELKENYDIALKLCRK